MADTSIREQLIAKIKAMSDEQVAALLQTAQALSDNPERPDYDPAKDPFLNGEFRIDGPTDLSETYKDILREDIDLRSGWTRKDKLP
jgi:hypothetical protein